MTTRGSHIEVHGDPFRKHVTACIANEAKERGTTIMDTEFVPSCRCIRNGHDSAHCAGSIIARHYRRKCTGWTDADKRTFNDCLVGIKPEQQTSYVRFASQRSNSATIDLGWGLPTETFNTFQSCITHVKIVTPAPHRPFVRNAVEFSGSAALDQRTAVQGVDDEGIDLS